MRANRDLTPWLLSLPALILLGVCFVFPVAQLMLLSLFKNTSKGSVFTFTLYTQFFTDLYTIGILWTTVKLSLITTLISLVLAFPVALYLRQVSPGVRSILVFLFLSPLLTSVVVRTLAWVYILGPKGVVNSGLISLGFMPVRLLYNETGVVIGLVHVFFGYMILSLMTSLLKIDDHLLFAASNLGASKLTILTRIVIPLSLPGILAGSVLVFTMSASTYATPALLGGTGTRMLSPEVYNLAITQLQWDEAATAATILFAVVAIVVGIGSRFVISGRRKIIFD